MWKSITFVLIEIEILSFTINRNKSNTDRNLIWNIRSLTRDSKFYRCMAKWFVPIFDITVKDWNKITYFLSTFAKIKNTSLLLSVIFILNAELIRERVNISNELTGGNEKEAMKEEKEHVKITRKKNQPRGGGGKKERADNSPDFRNTQAERNERCARDKGKVRMRIFRFDGGSCRGNNRIHLHPCPSIPSCAASGNLTLSDRTCLSPIVVSGYPSIFSFLFFIPLFLLSLLFFLFYLSTILPSNDSEKYTVKIVQIKRSLKDTIFFSFKFDHRFHIHAVRISKLRLRRRKPIKKKKKERERSMTNKKA